MKVFASQLNVKTEEYRNRRNHYLQLLAELNLRGKTVRQPPPEAAANLPARSRSAPVNAPRTCPNISLSITDADRAPQLMTRNGRSRRGDKEWMTAARRVLPVPVSP